MVTLLVLVFVVHPSGQLELVQRLPATDRQVCMAIVRRINDDPAHPLNAACYERGPSGASAFLQ